MITADAFRGGRTAEELGPTALARMVSRTQAGIIVLDTARRVVYANPAACRLLDEPLRTVHGHDLLRWVPVHERAAMAARLEPGSAGTGGAFTTTMGGPGTHGGEVAGSVFRVSDDARRLVVVTLWDQSGTQAAARAGVALARTAALVGGTDLDVVLQKIAEQAVVGTRATGCKVVIVEDASTADPPPSARGSRTVAGLLDRPTWIVFADASAADWVRDATDGSIRVGEEPGQPVVLPDAPTLWRSDPATHEFADVAADLPSEAAVTLPLSWRNRVIGVFVVFLPPGITVVTESELALLGALADQTSLAVMNARLATRADEVATVVERDRLAHELHDSVSQALFSMAMHARAGQLALNRSEAESDGPLAHALAEIAMLSREAATEMRGLILHLRADELGERDLVAAASELAAEISVRDDLPVLLDVPEPWPSLKVGAEQELYRILREALHNVVKHAAATAVRVRLERDEDGHRLVVTDDGSGFDPTSARSGFGLSTMDERARAIGARFVVESRPGAGTTVTVTLPGP